MAGNPFIPSMIRQTKKWVKFQSWGGNDPKVEEEFDEFIKNRSGHELGSSYGSRLDQSQLCRRCSTQLENSEDFSISRLVESQTSENSEISLPSHESTRIFRRTCSIRRDKNKYSAISELDTSPRSFSKSWIGV